MKNLFPYRRILITGGSGFIGSALIRRLEKYNSLKIFNFDKRSDSCRNFNFFDPTNYQHFSFNLNNNEQVNKAIQISDPDIIIHLAAESHVDRSIENPKNFIESNIVGTFNLLQSSTNFWRDLSFKRKSVFKFMHISTDEVFGSLGAKGKFDESSCYAPNSPYSASKASSDHLVRSWNRTYRLPTIITNCSNNYGPYQFPEKLLPLFINNIINNCPLPVYGDGNYTRDWLYVKDHAYAIDILFHSNKIGHTYNIGGFNEWKNIDLVKELCAQMDKKLNKEKNSSESLIEFVKDRPGHDLRYAIDASKINKDLNWKPSVDFKKGLSLTIDWYLNNKNWLKNVTSGEYRNYYKKQYSG